MEAVRLCETQKRISEPDLYHEPHNAGDRPMCGACVRAQCEVRQHISQNNDKSAKIQRHIPSVQSVNSRPEKHTAATHIKNTNSAIIPRSALGKQIDRQGRGKRYRIIGDQMNPKAERHNRG